LWCEINKLLLLLFEDRKVGRKEGWRKDAWMGGVGWMDESTKWRAKERGEELDGR
jgi:hypothetical protein